MSFEPPNPLAVDPWALYLPKLLDVLDGLAKRAVEDTNAASMSFLEHLQAIEQRVKAENREIESALKEIGDVNQLAEKQEEERELLDEAITDAIEFGSVVRREVLASRQAISSIAPSVAEMRSELSSIERISKGINILAVNATIEAARAGDAGLGFGVIAESVRQLANETQMITERLTPLVTSVHTEIVDYSGANMGATSNQSQDELSVKLDAQGALLKQVGESLESLSTDYAKLIEMKRVKRERSAESGRVLEETIRSALSSAQTGDIIRQQIETIINALSLMREVAASVGDTANIHAALDEVLIGLSSKFVMKSQHDVHAEIAGTGTTQTGEDDLPTFEMF